MIHDEDDMESGVYAVINRKIDTAKSFAFMSEHSNLFYVKAESMSAQQFGKISGYEKWHRRLGHTSNRDIHNTIPYVTHRLLKSFVKISSLLQLKISGPINFFR